MNQQDATNHKSKQELYTWSSDSGLTLNFSRYSGHGSYRYMPYWAAIVKELPSPTDRVLDIGAGCGVIGLDLLQRGLCEQATLSEIDEHCIHLMTKNIQDNNMSTKAKAIFSDGLKHIDKNDQFDLIVINFPMGEKWKEGLPEDENKLRWLDLGFNGTKEIYQNCWKHLKPNGHLIFFTREVNSSIPGAESINPATLSHKETIYLDSATHRLSSKKSYLPIDMEVNTDLYPRNRLFVIFQANTVSE